MFFSKCIEDGSPLFFIDFDRLFFISHDILYCL